MKKATLSIKERDALIRDIFTCDKELYFAFKKGKINTYLKKIKNWTCEKYDSEDFTKKSPIKYEINKKDIITYLQNHVSHDFFCIKKEKIFLDYMDLEDFTQENVKFLLKESPDNFFKFPIEVQERERFTYLCMYPQKVTEYSDEEILLAMPINPNIFIYLPSERVTKKLLYKALEILVKTEWIPMIEVNFSKFSYDFENVPEELKDKTYHQARAMTDIEYLKRCPKEYISDKLITYCVEHLFDKERNYTYALHILESIKSLDLPEEYIYPISYACCIRHFAGVECIPDNLKRDSFYNRLIEGGMYDFIRCVDLETISKETIIKAMKKMKNGQFWFWQKKFPKDFWDEKLALEYSRVSNMFFSHVPRNLYTKKMVITNIQHHSFSEHFSKIPEVYWDDETIKIAMKKSPYSVFQTPLKDKISIDMVMDCIKEGILYYRTLPTEYHTDEIIDAFIKYSFDKIEFHNIPHKYITKEFIEKCYKCKEHYHFSQGHQTEEITKMIYEVFKEQLPVDKWKHKLYMLSKVSVEVVKDMLHYISSKEILCGILTSYLSDDVLDYMFSLDQKNIIYFPEEKKEDYRKKISNDLVYKENKKPLETNKVEKRKAEEKQTMLDTFEQLSLFDFISA